GRRRRRRRDWVGGAPMAEPGSPARDRVPVIIGPEGTCASTRQSPCAGLAVEREVASAVMTRRALVSLVPVALLVASTLPAQDARAAPPPPDPSGVVRGTPKGGPGVPPLRFRNDTPRGPP